MKPHPAARPVEMLDHRLGLGDGLAAAVARLPVARATQGARKGGGGQAAVGELFLNQQTKEGVLHAALLKDRISPVRGPRAHHWQNICRRYLLTFREYQRRRVW